MKVWVTGYTGQLGYDVCRVLEERGIAYVGTGSGDCNITDAAAVEAFFAKEQPDAVIHCAACTAVDRAEDEPEKAYAVNETGTRNIAAVCSKANAKMLYISTDYVFPGTGETPYEPDDEKGSLNVYGKSKLAGELAVQELLARYYIVRISWVFGKNGNNFVKSMLRLAETRNELSVVADQIGSPTYTADLAPLLCDMIMTDKYGVYHATNEGFCSWAEFAEEIFRAAGKEVRVKHIATEEYPVKATRPLNSRMSKECLDEAGFVRLPEWQDAVRRYFNNGEKLSVKKIAVTGAGGYIGRHVVSALCDMGADVVAVCRRQSDIDPRAKTISLDIFTCGSDIYEQLCRPDACVHMAWRDGFVHNSPAHMEDLSKHYMFIENMINGGLRQLVVMGTMHEVGYWEGAIDENTPCNPLSMYGIAKDSLRRSVFLLAKEKGACLQWLRAYYIYGDDKKNHSIFTKLTQAEEAGQKTFPFTSGKNLYDFISVKDLAHQIASVAMQTDVDGVINCCTGKPISLAEAVENFIMNHDFKIKLEYGAFPDRPYDSPGVWGDAKIINKILCNLASERD